jgi:hypothetical protein
LASLLKFMRVGFSIRNLNSQCSLRRHYYLLRLLAAVQHETLMTMRPRFIYCSRASAAMLSRVLRTTTLSYANMRFSGSCPCNRNPSTDLQDEILHDWLRRWGYAMYQKGWNRLAGGGPTDRWNKTSKTFLTIPDLTLPYLTLPYFTLLFSSKPPMAQTTRFAIT